MQDTCIGDKIFLRVKETIFPLGLNFKILKGGTTDEGCNMSGTHKGFIGNVCKAVLETGAAKPMAIRCIIHQHCVGNMPQYLKL
jgi:hypothetical protein